VSRLSLRTSSSVLVPSCLTSRITTSSEWSLVAERDTSWQHPLDMSRNTMRWPAVSSSQNSVGYLLGTYLRVVSLCKCSATSSEGPVFPRFTPSPFLRIRLFLRIKSLITKELQSATKEVRLIFLYRFLSCNSITWSVPCHL